VLLIRPLVNSLEKLVNNKSLGNIELDDQKENQQPSQPTPQTEATPLHKSATLPLSPVKTESTNIVQKPPQPPTIRVKAESQLLTQPNRTPCPVCSVPIPDKAINQHVEKCLSTRKAPPVVQPVKKRSALPKLVYALLKDKELKNKCKEFGLNPKGDRKSLISRLQKYTLLYNTESQLEKPRSKMMILMQVEREEKEEKAGKFTTPALLQFDRKTESDVIEQKQKQYLKENKDTFTDMIKQVRERNKKKKSKKGAESEAPRECIDIVETVENLEDVSGAQEQRRSIEDLSETEFCEPIFDLPGPSKTTVAPVRDDSKVTNKPDAIPSAGKRSLSPTGPPVSPPRKQPKSSSKAVFITPKKSEMEELARSPMKSQNIFDRLTQSGEQLKRFPKIPCPVCNVGVTEKFLNIHLDKCLKSGEEPSPVFTRTKPKRKSHVKSVKPSVIARTVIEDSEDSEASLMLTFSDCDDDVFANTAVPPRAKHARGVVKPSIVEISDDPEVVETEKSDIGNIDSVPADCLQVVLKVEHEDNPMDAVDAAPKDALDETLCPPSPVYGQYTDTLSQGSYVQSQAPGVESTPDMFASGSEAEFGEEKDDLDSSRNLLEIEDDIEFMVEAALSEHEENEEEKEEKDQPDNLEKSQPVQEGKSQPENKEKSHPEKIKNSQPEEQKKSQSEIIEPSQPKKSKKRAVVTIIPIQIDERPAQPSEPEAPLARSTRRNLRLRTKAKLI